MNPYVDSAVLLKLYSAEPNSPDAIRLVSACTLPLPLTELHELEMRNALRLKCARSEITQQALQRAIAAFESDIASGRLLRTPAPWVDVFARAESFSASHSQATLCRSLDILHVACALALGSAEFITFDKRQAELARRAGLVVKS